MEQYTFGNSPAEKTLVKILTELDDKALTSYVARILEYIPVIIKNIECKNKITKKKMYLLLRKDVFTKIDKSIVIQRHPEISSYVKNCAVKRLRKIL